MNKLRLLTLMAFVAMLSSCNSQSQITQIEVTNQSSVDRVDNGVVISRAELGAQQDAQLLPAIKSLNGEWIPSQVDDVDVDGEWDELAILCEVKAGQADTYLIEWVEPAAYPQFTPRTNIRYGKYVDGAIRELATDSHDKYDFGRNGGEGNPYPFQMDGPTLENDKVGFRLYFDARNSIDYFGKKTSELVLDNVGISEEGLPDASHMQMHDWGTDILSCANSFGIGGLAMQTPAGLQILGIKLGETEDVVDLTSFTNVSEGPIRSIFRLDYKGWQIEENKIDLSLQITMWAGQYGFSAKVLTSQLPEGYSLVTGVVGDNNTQPQRKESYGESYISMSTHDKQSFNREWGLGMSVIIPTQNFVEDFQAPDGGRILKTWCAELKPDSANEYHYDVCAAWEFGVDPKYASRDEYMKLVDSYGEQLLLPLSVKLK